MMNGARATVADDRISRVEEQAQNQCGGMFIYASVGVDGMGSQRQSAASKDIMDQRVIRSASAFAIASY
jgi:hypothetical protein